MTLRAAFAAALAALLALEGAAATARPITIDARPIPVAPRLLAGQKASFLAALRLTAADPQFGGLSGLTLEGERLTAIGDRGIWLTARLVRDAAGAAAGLEDAEIGALKDRSGAALRGFSADAEALTSDGGGGWWIGFERRHRVTRRPRLDAAADATAAQLPTDPLGRNAGVEGLARSTDGALWALAEAPSGDGAEVLGWRMKGGGLAPFRIERQDGYDATGADFGPDGALYLLERRYSFFTGVRMRIRRFDAATLAQVGGPTAVRLGAGETLAQLGPTGPIDNMEAISVEARADGRLILTALSDDNFSSSQSTVLLQFLVDPAP